MTDRGFDIETAGAGVLLLTLTRPAASMTFGEAETVLAWDDGRLDPIREDR